MSSSIYNHRSLQPQGPPPVPPQAHSPARVTEALDILRQEFELSAQDVVLLRGQKDEFENRIHAQINELNHIKQMVYELENQHTKARQQYEDDVNRLRAELAQARQTIQQAQAAQAQAQAQPPILPPHPATAGTPATGPPPPGTLPPSSASPHTAHAGMGHPGPGYGEPPYGYRSRDDVRERDVRDVRDSRDVRDVRERDVRDRDLRDTRELRDRDVRDRDLRDREAREREREPRDRDSREVKRIKTERPKDYAPSATHKSYPESSSSAVVVSSSSSLPPPPVAGPTPYPPSAPPASGGAFLDDINPETLPPDLKKEGPDWFAIFNPKVKRVLDVNLTNTLNHESVVCCVRFSADGKYLATGCNRTAQIYDTKTGQKICVLNDESANPVGDLYIRSVCFSPDGKLLATGAEDKTIRIWEIAKKRVKRVLKGHRDSVYSVAFTPDGKGIVSGSLDKTLKHWDISAIVNGSRKDPLPPPTTPTGSSSASASGSGAGNNSGAATRPKENGGGGERGSVNTLNFTGHKDYVLSVAVSHDGQWIVSGSKDRGVQFWEARTAQVQAMLQGHKNSVISIDLSPTGGILATGSGDMQARLWSYTTI
ncbi:TUP1_2 [Sanghuangporus weigelae]